MTTKFQNQYAIKDDLNKLETKIGKDIRGFKNEIKEDIKGYKDEMKTYMGVLYEKFDNEVKVVAEQYITIDQRLTRVESKTDMLVETVGDIKVDTAMIREELENKTDKSEHKKLEHRVAVLESGA